MSKSPKIPYLALPVFDVVVVVEAVDDTKLRFINPKLSISKQIMHFLKKCVQITCEYAWKDEQYAKGEDLHD